MLYNSPARALPPYLSLLSPAQTLLLSPLLVALTTWLLFTLQTILKNTDPFTHVRPFESAYLIPLVALTVLGGRGAGLLTLLLSAVASAYCLSTPIFSWEVEVPRDRVELSLLLVTGSGLLFISSYFHQALQDLSDALMKARVETQVRDVVAAVDGICRLKACQVEKAGLDYHVTLTVGSCRATNDETTRTLAGNAEQALRHANPLITKTQIRVEHDA